MRSSSSNLWAYTICSVEGDSLKLSGGESESEDSQLSVELTRANMEGSITKYRESSINSVSSKKQPKAKVTIQQVAKFIV